MTESSHAPSHSQCVDNLDLADARLQAAVVAFTRACWDHPDWMPFYSGLVIDAVRGMREAAIALKSTHIGARGEAA